MLVVTRNKCCSEDAAAKRWPKATVRRLMEEHSISKTGSTQNWMGWNYEIEAAGFVETDESSPGSPKLEADDDYTAKQAVADFNELIEKYTLPVMMQCLYKGLYLTIGEKHLPKATLHKKLDDAAKAWWVLTERAKDGKGKTAKELVAIYDRVHEDD